MNLAFLCHYTVWEEVEMDIRQLFLVHIDDTVCQVINP